MYILSLIISLFRKIYSFEPNSEKLSKFLCRILIILQIGYLIVLDEGSQQIMSYEQNSLGNWNSFLYKCFRHQSEFGCDFSNYVLEIVLALKGLTVIDLFVDFITCK